LANYLTGPKNTIVRRPDGSTKNPVDNTPKPFPAVIFLTKGLFPVKKNIKIRLISCARALCQEKTEIVLTLNNAFFPPTGHFDVEIAPRLL